MNKESIQIGAHDLSSVGRCERNSAKPKARRAERAGASESTITKLAYLIRNRGNTLAIFGKARLVKDHTGRITLEGGSPDERQAAREWCSHFLHEAALDVSSNSSSALRASHLAQNPLAA